MKRHLIIFGTVSLALFLGLGPASMHAQSRGNQHQILLEAQLQRGQILRYELEAAGSFLPIADSSGAMLNPPRGRKPRTRTETLRSRRTTARLE
jgi:hypothetical protein